LSPAVGYVHFKTKADLLYEISRTGNDEALRNMTAETTEPAARLSTIGDEQAAGDLGAITPDALHVPLCRVACVHARRAAVTVRNVSDLRDADRCPRQTLVVDRLALRQARSGKKQGLCCVDRVR
jgi:hypothetical protein